MKKIFAMLLVVAMLLTSVVAMAEPLPAYSLVLQDVRMLMDGEVIMDLEGLKVVLSATEDGAAATAQVYGGDELAATGIVATSGTKAAITIDGMAKALTIDMEELAKSDMFAGAMDENQMLGMQKFETALESLMSGEGLAGIEDASADYMAAIQNLLLPNMAMEEGTYDFVMDEAAEQPASIIKLTLTGETLGEMMKEAYKLYDSQPVFLDLINGILLMGGEEEIASFSGMMDESGLYEELAEIDLGAAIYINADGTLMDIEINVYDDITAAEPYFQGGALLSVSAGETVNAMFLVVDEYGDQAVCYFDMVPSEEFPGETEYHVYAEEISGEESETVMTAWVGPDADFGTLGSIVMYPDDEYDNLGIAWSYSDTQASLNFYDDSNDLIIGYETAFEGAEPGEALVYMTYEENGSAMEIQFVASLIEGEIDSAMIDNVLAMDGIDVLTMSEDDMEAYGTQAAMIMMGALGVLSNNVPGLSALMGF